MSNFKKFAAEITKGSVKDAGGLPDREAHIRDQAGDTLEKLFANLKEGMRKTLTAPTKVTWMKEVDPELKSVSAVIKTIPEWERKLGRDWRPLLGIANGLRPGDAQEAAKVKEGVGKIDQVLKSFRAS